MKQLSILFIITLFTFSYQIDAQTFYEDFKSLPVQYLNNAGDLYGQSVSVDGDFAIVGAPYTKNDLGCAYLLHNTGATWETVSILTASDGVSGDFFGSSVSISGDIALVGAYGDDKKGSAYVFEIPSGGWTNMTEIAKLTASDGDTNDYFGHSVSISGDVIVIGACYNEINGSAYLYKKPANGWVDMTQTAKLTSSGISNSIQFGYSVSISESVVVIGAVRDDDYNGSAYIFEEPLNGWTDMTQTAKLTYSDSVFFSYFGCSVSISGDVAVIGSFGTNKVYLFERTGIEWTDMAETAQLTRSDQRDFGQSVCINGDTIVVGSTNSSDAHIFVKPVGGWIDMNETATLSKTYNNDAWNWNNGFGSSVSISSGVIFIGADTDNERGEMAGSAYIFKKPTGNWSNAIENQKIFPSEPYLNNGHEYFGTSVDIFEDYAVVGDPGYMSFTGCAYVLHNTGTSWERVAILTASNENFGDYFGNSVSIDKDVIVIGAHSNGVNSLGIGCAYVFVKPETGWTDTTETATLIASDGDQSDYFGISVSINNDVIAVGADGDDNFFESSGAVYVFEKPAGGWADATQTAKLTSSEAKEGAGLGTSVCVSENTIVAGANTDEVNGIRKGSAYVFEKPANGWADMTHTAKLTASDGAAYDYFGIVSIYNDVIAVGAERADNGVGAVYVFEKPTGGWIDMTQTAKLIASDRKQWGTFGTSVCIYEDIILIGDKNSDNTGYVGSAYFFKKPESGWANMTQSVKIAGSDGKYGDCFGNSVSIYENTAIVGARENDENGKNAGSVYFYQLCFLDSENPSITCIDNQTRNLTAGQNSYIVSGNEFDPTNITDNCKIATIFNDFNSDSTLKGANFPVGSTKVNWTATDLLGNQIQCTMNVTINGLSKTKEPAYSGISVYPNPVKDNLSIEFNDDNINRLIKISDLSGTVLIEKNISDNNQIIDFSGLKKGFYIINIISEIESINLKILKD